MIDRFFRRLFYLRPIDSWRIWFRQFFCWQCGGYDLDRPDKFCAYCGNGPEGRD